uniref:uncharacterized protein LOC120346446 n=1 Tax=Styela clava TaxID=7725 RepID=UPI00193AD727|nr:uncharacterized protein LOC120346446 [Styela clava]
MTMTAKVETILIVLILVVFCLKQGMSGTVESKCYLSEEERRPEGQSGKFRITAFPEEFPKTCIWEPQFNASSSYFLRICGRQLRDVQCPTTNCTITPVESIHDGSAAGSSVDPTCFVLTTDDCYVPGSGNRKMVSSLPTSIKLTMKIDLGIESFKYSYSKCDNEGPEPPTTQVQSTYEATSMPQPTNYIQNTRDSTKSVPSTPIPISASTPPETHWSDTTTYNLSVTTHTSQQGSNTLISTILPIVIAVVVAALLGGLLFIWCRYRKKKQKSSVGSEQATHRTGDERHITENVIYESSSPHTNDNQPAAMMVDNIIYGQTIV